MNNAARIFAALPGVLFVVMGVRWIAEPSAAAEAIGLPLLDGVARSSQIGDLGSFFLSSGAMILYGVATRKRTWLYAPALLIGGAAVCRILAWLVQDAPFPPELIGPEIVMTAILLFAASKMSPEGAAQ
jgi:hypothetical protein